MLLSYFELLRLRTIVVTTDFDNFLLSIHKRFSMYCFRTENSTSYWPSRVYFELYYIFLWQVCPRVAHCIAWSQDQDCWDVFHTWSNPVSITMHNWQTIWVHWCEKRPNSTISSSSFTLTGIPRLKGTKFATSITQNCSNVAKKKLWCCEKMLSMLWKLSENVVENTMNDVAKDDHRFWCAFLLPKHWLSCVVHKIVTKCCKNVANIVRMLWMSQDCEKMLQCCKNVVMLWKTLWT